MKIRYSLRTKVLRWLSLVAVAPMAFTSSTEFPHSPKTSVANIISQSSDSVWINPSTNSSKDDSHDRNAGDQHYVVGMHLSFTTNIEKPVLHVVLLKQDDRSQSYSLQIESSQPVSFEGDAMLIDP